jgi:hypothetical protein
VHGAALAARSPPEVGTIVMALGIKTDDLVVVSIVT